MMMRMPAVQRVLDGLGHFGARRVDHADKAEEREVGLDGVRRVVGERGWQVAFAHRQHAQGLPRHLVVLARDALPQLGGHGDDVAVQAHPRAAGQRFRRRALHVGRLAFAIHVDDRHAFADGLERQLVDLGPFDELRLQVEVGLLGGDQQAALRRVADHTPTVLLAGRQDLGVVAERHGAHDALQAAPRLVPRQLGAFDHEAADRLVAGAGHLQLLIADVQRLDRHLGLRKRAGLVGADDVRRSERLYG